ncbi:hypothetical protein [Aliagarivorans marinus]|uniref:hypothetical protein n=1 Tax=Aliagarivorans marinus TaxID=561965 RepID=UPI0003FEE019|nr:hypothetical protein [Aliagarivorans marinus]
MNINSATSANPYYPAASQPAKAPVPAEKPAEQTVPVQATANAAADVEDNENPSKLKSFSYGALGMDHPAQVEETEDKSYTMGQYLKAAATIGSLIALAV